jgi:uncharacterized RDD family membrane protein YckC
MGPQELGAFGGIVAEPETDAPIIAVPSTSRPLSVRRPAAEPARPAPRIERRPGPIDRDLLEDLRRLEREETLAKKLAALARAADQPDVHSEVAASHRIGAAALDALLLGGIGTFVLWATLKLCNAAPSDLGASAIIPLGVFLGGIGVVYLLMFTAAGGQTLGKMLMSLRVVPEGPAGARMTLGQAATRAILAPLSVGALGLGWAPALLGRGPALHDRISHTRVVRA